MEERPPSGASVTALARLDLGLEWQERVLAADVADQLVQEDLLAEVAGAQLNIEGLDLLEHRRVLRAVVLELQHPLDGGVALECRDGGADAQLVLGSVQLTS